MAKIVRASVSKGQRESINFKLPKPLADALRAKAVELDTTATNLVIEGLHHILGEIPGIEDSVETRLQQLEAQLNHLSNSTDKRVDTGVDNRRAFVRAETRSTSFTVGKN